MNKPIIAFLSLSCLCFQLHSQCWNLVWEDEFTGTTLNTDYWSYQTGAGGWGNNELQYYTDRVDNVNVTGGNLEIIALEENYNGANYTSGRIRTLDKAQWTYGKMEARIQVPEGQGIWPAFWMMPSDNAYGSWPGSGELDIMELLGHEPDICYTTLHYGYTDDHQSQGTSYQLPGPDDFADGFHDFSVEWEPNKIEWFVDDVSVFILTDTDLAPYPWVFDRDFHFILNVAVGGNWPGPPDNTTVFPQTMLVDYVRVYQLLDNIDIWGNDHVMPNSTNLTYTVPDLPGASYVWTVPADMTITGGQSTHEITVDVGTTSGDITCVITNGCGTVTALMPVEVTINFWPNYGFEQSYAHWNTRDANGGEANFNITTSDPQEGLLASHVEVITPGQNGWDIQLSRDDVPLVEGTDYSLEFWAKADINGRQLPIAFIDLDDYTGYASTTFTLTNSWAEYSFDFTAPATANGLFNIDLGGEAGDFYFDDFLFTETSLLPIELAEFYALLNDDHTVSLHWTTLSETNNDYFQIERSASGDRFDPIGTIKGAGESFASQQYTYKDRHPFNDQNYYRLKQVDLDGKFSYSPIRSLTIPNGDDILPFPNPVINELFVPLSENTAAKVFNSSGQLVTEQALTPQNNRAVLITSGLPKGWYLLQFTEAGVLQQYTFNKR